MKITCIKYKNKRIKEVYVEDNFFSDIDIDLINKYNLKTSFDYSGELLNEVKEESDLKRARYKTFSLLEYRDHTRLELKNKLLKLYSEEIVEKTLNEVESLGFIDDSRMARKLADYYIDVKRLGAKKAIFEMKLKGIPQEEAQKVIDEKETDFKAELEELIILKYTNKLKSKNGEQKVVAALARRGHSFNDIRVAVNKVKEKI